MDQLEMQKSPRDESGVNYFGAAMYAYFLDLAQRDVVPHWDAIRRGEDVRFTVALPRFDEYHFRSTSKFAGAECLVLYRHKRYWPALILDVLFTKEAQDFTIRNGVMKLDKTHNIVFAATDEAKTTLISLEGLSIALQTANELAADMVEIEEVRLHLDRMFNNPSETAQLFDQLFNKDDEETKCRLCGTPMKQTTWKTLSGGGQEQKVMKECPVCESVYDASQEVFLVNQTFLYNAEKGGDAFLAFLQSIRTAKGIPLNREYTIEEVNYAKQKIKRSRKELLGDSSWADTKPWLSHRSLIPTKPQEASQGL